MTNVYKVTMILPGDGPESPKKTVLTEQIAATDLTAAVELMADMFSADSSNALSITAELVANRQEAVRRISELTQEARDLIDEATRIADEAGVDVEWDLQYGMGGWYSSGEWHASSQSC